MQTLKFKRNAPGNYEAKTDGHEFIIQHRDYYCEYGYGRVNDWVLEHTGGDDWHYPVDTFNTYRDAKAAAQAIYEADMAAGADHFNGEA